MTRFRQVRLSLIATVLGLSAASLLMPAVACADTPVADAKAPAEVLRPEIAQLLIAAKTLFDGKNIPEALTTLTQADAVADKTPYEVFAVERTRGDYYLKAGDKAKAAQAFEKVVAANYLKHADQINIIQVISQLYFQASNYPLAVSWMERYFKEGGSEPRDRDILNKAYYLNKDYAQAYKGLSAYVAAELAAGHIPDEQHFQLILNSASFLNAKEDALKAVEQLNAYYPSSKSWNFLISQVYSEPGFSEKLVLDIFRLKQELSLLKTASEYVEMSELATRAGLPAEAKRVLDQANAAGLLSAGPDAKKYAAMLDAANKRAAEDVKTMQQGEAGAAGAKAGTGLVNLGMAYATAGQPDKGAGLIEQGISKGGVSRIEEAKLHLGLVYYWAGKKEAAIKQLKTVQGSDGTADLARYWIMQINRPLAK